MYGGDFPMPDIEFDAEENLGDPSAFCVYGLYSVYTMTISFGLIECDDRTFYAYTACAETEFKGKLQKC